jgi:hypothetical protein
MCSEFDKTKYYSKITFHFVLSMFKQSFKSYNLHDSRAFLVQTQQIKEPRKDGVFVNILKLHLCLQHIFGPHIQSVPLATEPGISLIILTPMKILQRTGVHSLLSHFLHNELSPLQISLQYPY